MSNGEWGFFEVLFFVGFVIESIYTKNVTKVILNVVSLVKL